MKSVAVISDKGGVGKTTLSVTLACYLARHGNGKVLLVDADNNRSALGWASEDLLPFTVCTEKKMAKVLDQERFDFIIFDTYPNLSKEDLADLSDSDLLLLVTTPDALSLDVLRLLVKRLPEGTNHYVLINRIPPPPQRDGVDAFAAIKSLKYPVLGYEAEDGNSFYGIRDFKAYKQAAAFCKPVYEVKNGATAWSDWQKLAELKPIQELLSKQVVSPKS